MMDNDWLVDALANLPRFTPDAEWQARVRARCHSEMSRRARRRRRRSTGTAAAAVLALCFYLAAVLRAAARFAGWF